MKQHFMGMAEAVTRSGLSATRIRNLEERGIVPAFHRTDNGHRLFTPHDILLLRRVKIYRDQRREDGHAIYGWDYIKERLNPGA